jgi:hypothetical protein
MWSEGSSGREAAADSASTVSSTARERLTPDVRRSIRDIRKISGPANSTVSVASQIDGRQPTRIFIISIYILQRL